MKTRVLGLACLLALVIADASAATSRRLIPYGYRMKDSDTYTTGDDGKAVFSNSGEFSIPINKPPYDLKVVYGQNQSGMKVSAWLLGASKKGSFDPDSLAILDEGVESLDLSEASGKCATVDKYATEHSVKNPYILLEFDWINFRLRVDGQSLGSCCYTNRISLSIPQRTGYTFGGWTNATLNLPASTTFVQGATLGVTNHDDTAEIAIASKWTANEYSVTCDWNGGTPTTCPTTAVYDKEFTVQNPSRTGYEFSGWEVQGKTAGAVIQPKTGETAFKNLNSTSGGSVKLVAQWASAQFTVSINSVGGTGGQESVTVRYGEPYQYVSCPTRAGSAFLGYSIGGVSYWNMYGQPVKDTWDILSNVTAVAQWQAQTFHVTYVANGGDGQIPTQSFLYMEEITLSTGAGLSRNGCRLLGWSTVSTASVPDPGCELGAVCRFESDKVLYAVWEIGCFVAFEGNGASSGQMDTLRFLCNVQTNLPANAFRKTGYSFAGWAKNAEDAGKRSVTYRDRDSVKFTDEPGSTNVLWAVWDTNTYYVAFDGAGGTGGPMNTETCHYDQAFALPANRFASPDEMHVFGGWLDEVNQKTYADGAAVSNLCWEAGATNVLKAIWKLNVGPWSEAMHCSNLVWDVTHVQYDPSTHTLQIFNGPELGYAQSGSCVGQDGKGTIDKEWLYAHVTTNGCLTFRCKWNRQPTQPSSKIPPCLFYAVTDSEPDVVGFQYYEAITGDWQRVEIPVVLGDGQDFAYVYLLSAMANDEGGDILYIDQMTWTPAGTEPTYAEDDSPVAGFSAGSDKIGFSFESGGGTYHVLGTNDLLAPMPWPLVFMTNAVPGPVAVELPKKADEPTMFYRIRALK